MKESKVTVLLVSPNSNFKLLLPDFLEMKGFEVFIFDTSIVEYLPLPHLPDLIIIDISPPIDKAKAFALSIKKKSPKIPIIGITAWRIVYEEKEQFGDIASAFMLKPFDPEDLVATMLALVGKRSVR